MKAYFTFFIIACYIPCIGQQLTSAAGGTATHQEVSIAWSIGEPIIGTSVQNIQNASIGFQQPFDRIVSAINEPKTVAVSLYPNPAKEYIIVALPDVKNGLFSLTIFNLTGSVILQQSFESKQGKLEVDISGFGSGLYRLVVASENAKAYAGTFIKL